MDRFGWKMINKITIQIFDSPFKKANKRNDQIFQAHDLQRALSVREFSERSFSALMKWKFSSKRLVNWTQRRNIGSSPLSQAFQRSRGCHLTTLEFRRDFVSPEVASNPLVTRRTFFLNQHMSERGGKSCMARSNTPFDTQQATETFYAMTECICAYRTRFSVITSFHASQGSCS